MCGAAFEVHHGDKQPCGMSPQLASSSRLINSHQIIQYQVCNSSSVDLMLNHLLSSSKQALLYFQPRINPIIAVLPDVHLIKHNIYFKTNFLLHCWKQPMSSTLTWISGSTLQGLQCRIQYGFTAVFCIPSYLGLV